MIRAGTGNILHAPAEALVNTVNCVGAMGKGLALQFKRAFPAMYRAYHRDAKAGRVQTGLMHVFALESVQPRLIINFPTKQHWRGKSKLEFIESGMVDLRRVIVEHALRSIAIPPLGAGLGGLDWCAVRPLIVAGLEDLDVDVLLWEPGHRPSIESRPVNSARPRMTLVRAVLMVMMDWYRRIQNHDPTHIEVQKLAYFFHEAGGFPKMKFSRNKYGPYSDELYHALSGMEGHYFRGVEDRRPDAELSLEKEAVAEATDCLQQHPEAAPRLERIYALIDGFENPYGLEMLATIHFCARQNPLDAATPEAAIAACHAWNDRKRAVMHPEHIKVAWHRLSEQGWLDV